MNEQELQTLFTHRDRAERVTKISLGISMFGLGLLIGFIIGGILL